MSTAIEPSDESDESVAQLLRGLAADVKDVALGELAATKLEAKVELGELKRTAIASVVVGILSLLTGFSLVSAGAHGLSDGLGIALSLGYVVISAALLAMTGLALASARRPAKQIDLLPEDTAADTKEDAAWIANKTKSALK